MEDYILQVLQIYKLIYIFVGILMLTVIELKVHFIFSIMYVASTSNFVEGAIRNNKKVASAQQNNQQPSASVMTNIINFKKLDFTFELTEKVKISLNSEHFLLNFVKAISLRIVCCIFQKSIQALPFDILLLGLRMLLVHLFGNINTHFWIIELSYPFIGIFLDYTMIQGEMTCKQNIDPFLLLYLFGIYFMVLTFGKNFRIEKLEKVIKVKNELIKRLVQDNSSQPTMLFKLNDEMIEKMDFAKEGQHKCKSSLFTAFESTLPTKYLISPMKVLYDVTMLNKAAAQFIGQSKPDLSDIQNKFKSIVIPREKGMFLQEKNLHKIMNQSSAILYKDLITKKISSQESTNILRQFDLTSEQSQGDKEEVKSVSSSESGIIDSNEIRVDVVEDNKFKKLSDLSMLLFEEEFQIEKNLNQKIRCTIVYDTFLIAISDPAPVDLFCPKDQQEEDERPTQSQYFMPNAQTDLIVKSPKNNGNSPQRPNDNFQSISKHRSKHVIKKDKFPNFEKSQNCDIRKFLSGSRQNPIEDEKKSSMLEQLQEGSLKSQEMFQSSQSTVRINIESEQSLRSFYSEINLSKGLSPSVRKESRNNFQVTELKNQQKEMALEFYKKRVADLERDLSNTKIFLNKVIQEVRNPINNVSLAVDQGLSSITKAQKLLNKYEGDLINDIMFNKNTCRCANVMLSPQLNRMVHASFNESMMRVPEHSNSINSIPVNAPKSNQAKMVPGSQISQINQVPLAPIPRRSASHDGVRVSAERLNENMMRSAQIPLQQQSNLVIDNLLVNQIANENNSISRSHQNFQAERINEIRREQVIIENIEKMSQNIVNQKNLFELRFQQSQQLDQQAVSSDHPSIPSVRNQSIFSGQPQNEEEEEKQQPSNPPNNSKGKSQFFIIEDEMEDEQSESIKNFELRASKQMVELHGSNQHPNCSMPARSRPRNSSSNVSDDSMHGKIEKIKCPSFRLRALNSPQVMNDRLYEHFNEHLKQESSESNISAQVDEDKELKGQLEEINMLQNDRIKGRLKARKREINEIRRLLKKSKSLMEGCEYSLNLTANLINDLVDFARTEQFCFNITKHFFDLVETIQNSFNVLRFESKRKNVQMKLLYDQSTLYGQVYSDQSRYVQILLNMLSNSLKHTNEGGTIEFRLESLENINMTASFALDLDIKDEEGEQKDINVLRYIQKMQMVRQKIFNINNFKEMILTHMPDFINEYKYLKFKISILDSGPELNEHGLQNMFLNFEQLSDRNRQSPREAGLGLSICKNLIEKMGGSVKVTSGSEGTTFTVQMIEIVRIGKDKRENFSVEQEIDLDQIVSQIFKNGKFIQDGIAVIKERGSASEDGNSSSMSKPKNDFSEHYKNIGEDIADAVSLMKENENHSEQNCLMPRSRGSMRQSEQFMNKLNIINSLNSNDLDLSNSNQMRLSKKRVLLQEFRNMSKKESLPEDNGSNPDRKNSLVKKQVDQQLSQYGGKKKNNSLVPGSLEDISLSESNCDSDEDSSQSNIIARDPTRKKAVKHAMKINDFEEFQNLSILIANKDYQTLLEIEQVFNEFYIFDIEKADNGMVAYEKALSHKFDLIILDMNMQIMSGLETCKKIMEHYTRRLIMINEDERQSYGNSSGSSVRMPKIFGIAEKLDSSLIAKAKKAGFTDCLQTPLNSQKASDIIMSYLDDLIKEHRQEANEQLEVTPPKPKQQTQKQKYSSSQQSPPNLMGFPQYTSHCSDVPGFISQEYSGLKDVRSNNQGQSNPSIDFSKSESLSDHEEQKEVDNSKQMFGRSYKRLQPPAIDKPQLIKKQYMRASNEIIDEDSGDDISSDNNQ